MRKSIKLIFTAVKKCYGIYSTKRKKAKSTRSNGEYHVENFKSCDLVIAEFIQGWIFGKK